MPTCSTATYPHRYPWLTFGPEGRWPGIVTTWLWPFPPPPTIQRGRLIWLSFFHLRRQWRPRRFFVRWQSAIRCDQRHWVDVWLGRPARLGVCCCVVLRELSHTAAVGPPHGGDEPGTGHAARSSHYSSTYMHGFPSSFLGPRGPGTGSSVIDCATVRGWRRRGGRE